MNTTELLAKLQEEYAKVGVPEEHYADPSDKEKREAEGVKLYRVFVYKLAGTVGERIAVFYYVKDEGELTEEAFFRGDVAPFEAEPQTYSIAVRKLLDDKIQSGKIIRATAKEVNEELKWAIVRVFELEGGVAVEKAYLIYEDENDVNQMVPAKTDPTI